MTSTQELLNLLVTLLNVILNTYQDKRRSNLMAIYVGVFANIRTLEEGKKVCLHNEIHLVQTQEPTRDNRCLLINENIPHGQLYQFKHLEARMCQSREQVVWGPVWED